MTETERQSDGMMRPNPIEHQAHVSSVDGNADSDAAAVLAVDAAVSQSDTAEDRQKITKKVHSNLDDMTSHSRDVLQSPQSACVTFSPSDDPHCIPSKTEGRSAHYLNSAVVPSVTSEIEDSWSTNGEGQTLDDALHSSSRGRSSVRSEPPGRCRDSLVLCTRAKTLPNQCGTK